MEEYAIKELKGEHQSYLVIADKRAFHIGEEEDYK
jgi:hypothetical protein